MPAQEGLEAMSREKKKKTKKSTENGVRLSGVAEEAIDFGKALSILLPVPLSLAAQMILSALGIPVKMRQQQLLQETADGLQELQARFNQDLTPEKLAQDPAFVTAFLQVHQIAMRNHQKEKLEALRNALLNVALKNTPDESLQLIFLNFIDTFTPWHMEILNYLDNPSSWMKQRGVPVPTWGQGSLKGLISIAMKDLQRPPGLDDFVLQDLKTKGLIPEVLLGAAMSMEGLLGSWTSEMGKDFINFVTSPLDDSAK